MMAEQVQVGAHTFSTTLTREDFPPLQQILQNISMLQPGQPISDALRDLRPSAAGCARRIVGPISATVEETCPEAVQVPRTEVYQDIVNQPVQRTEYVPVCRVYNQQIPVTRQRQVLQTYIQQRTQQIPTQL